MVGSYEFCNGYVVAIGSQAARTLLIKADHPPMADCASIFVKNQMSNAELL